jgi:hypothetical protein
MTASGLPDSGEAPNGRVLEDGGDGAVVLGGDEEHGVRGVDGGAEGDGRGGRGVAVDVLVVEGQVDDAVVGRELDALRRVVRGGLGELAVDRVGAEAADECEDVRHGDPYWFVDGKVSASTNAIAPSPIPGTSARD